MNKIYNRKIWSKGKNLKYFNSIIFGFLLWLFVFIVLKIAWSSFYEFKKSYWFRGLKVRLPDAEFVSNHMISANDLIVWMDKDYEILFAEKYSKSYDKNEFIRKNKKYNKVFLIIDKRCNMNQVFKLTKFLQNKGHTKFISFAIPGVI